MATFYEFRVSTPFDKVKSIIVDGSGCTDKDARSDAITIAILEFGSIATVAQSATKIEALPDNAVGVKGAAWAWIGIS